jgi:hypothetical protein
VRINAPALIIGRLQPVQSIFDVGVISFEDMLRHLLGSFRAKYLQWSITLKHPWRQY